MRRFFQKKNAATESSNGFRLGGRKHRLLSESSNIEDELLPQSVRMSLWLTASIVLLFLYRMVVRRRGGA